jgi:hypothetical protein
MMSTMGAAAAAGGAGFILIILIIALYFIPTIIATSRKVTNTGSVFVINLLLGWSVIGWVVALAMAVKSKTPQVVVVQSAAALPGCAKCGTGLLPGQQFCSNCGAPRLVSD